MPSEELRRLHDLFLIDSALLEIRKRAAALDPGKKVAAEIQTLEKHLNESQARKLQVEQTDLELKQKSYQEKIDKFDKQLYGGKVVNPREVEAIQKEIAILKRQRGELDERILEIWEELPPQREAAEKIEKAISQRKVLLAQEQKHALESRTALEAEFKNKAAERTVKAKAVPPALLAKYESIRQKHGGVGMGEVDVKKRTCGSCGTSLPVRAIEGIKEERIVTCESCHRILYFSEDAF